jgi:TrmH family RNA methyltransferase
MKSISSKQNAWYRRARAAIHQHDREIVIEGPKAVADAVRVGWRPIAVISDGSSAAEGEVPLDAIVFTRELFEMLAQTRNAQGIIGLFERPIHQAAAILASRGSLIVALDGVQDPGNVGTIVRLAAAFEAEGVLLLPGCADPFAPKAVRASAGAILNVPVAEVTPEEIMASQLPMFAADRAGIPIEPPQRAAILILGNEGVGVSPPLREASTVLAIPISSRVESLNVAAAAAILLARSYVLRIG